MKNFPAVKAENTRDSTFFSLEFGQNFYFESLQEHGLIEVALSTRNSVLSLYHLISSSVRTEGLLCLCSTTLQHFDGRC